jgi:hypothetical protein
MTGYAVPLSEDALSQPGRAGVRHSSRHAAIAAIAAIASQAGGTISTSGCGRSVAE